MSKFLSRSTEIHNTLNSNPTNVFNGYVPQGKDAHDPYISGYAFIKWLSVPKWIDQNFKDFSERNFKAFSGVNDITMDTAGVTAGFTRTELAFDTNITKTGDFTLKYQEHSGSPLTSIYNAWVSGIRDPKTGIATYPKEANLPYHSSNHTGTLLYVVTRPDADNFEGKNIEFAALFTRCMPTKIPLNHFNFESGSHDPTELDQEFKAYMHIGAAVEDFAAKYISGKIYTFNNENEFTDSDSLLAL